MSETYEHVDKERNKLRKRIEQLEKVLGEIRFEAAHGKGDRLLEIDVLCFDALSEQEKERPMCKNCRHLKKGELVNSCPVTKCYPGLYMLAPRDNNGDLKCWEPL